MPRRVFYSFYYGEDVFRVQQIRNIGAIEENKPVSPNKWENIKSNGPAAIKRWINQNMENKSCVVVLIGNKTASRRYVQYEIEKAWNDGKGLLGIYIHNIKCPILGKSSKGENPFKQFKLNNGQQLSDIIKCYNPSPFNAYNDIKVNIEEWIEEAIRLRN